MGDDPKLLTLIRPPLLHATDNEFVIIPTLVHSTTLAIAEEGAIGTWLFFCHP